jgi:small nuclear ribonucleoprotein (snRNP)-like protein
MSIFFSNEDIGKNMIITLKNGEVIEGQLLDFEPIIKIKLKNGNIKKFLEAKIDDIEELSEGVINFDKKMENILDNFLIDMKKYKDNISISKITFDELIEELKEIKKEDITFYLDLNNKIFNKLRDYYKNNIMDFKYDKTNRLLFELKTLYEIYQDVFIDKIIAYILQVNNISYKAFFKAEPIDFYTIRYDLEYFI